MARLQNILQSAEPQKIYLKKVKIIYEFMRPVSD